MLTQHGKESVIAPVLDAALGCRVERVGGFDTDTLGTFTRNIPRAGSQIEAARRKARIGMELSGLPLGLASEGAFGPDPMACLLPWNVELLLFIDDERGIEVKGMAQQATRFARCAAHRVSGSWSGSPACLAQTAARPRGTCVRPFTAASSAAIEKRASDPTWTMLIRDAVITAIREVTVCLNDVSPMRDDGHPESDALPVS